MSTYIVTFTTDPTTPLPGTLRYAVNQANANPGSTINITTGGTISLLQGPLDLSADVTINGLGQYSTTISNTTSNVFNISSSTSTTVITANINGMGIIGIGLGSSIYSYATGNLNLNNCLFQNNTTSGYVMLYLLGLSSLSNCIFTGNTITYINSANDLSIISCQFTSASVNSTPIIVSGSTVTFNGSSFSGLTIGSSSIISSTATSISFTNTSFSNLTNNTPNIPMFSFAGSTVTFSGCTLSSLTVNSSATTSPIIQSTATSIRFDTNSIFENSSISSTATPFINAAGNSIVLDSCSMTNCSSQFYFMFANGGGNNSTVNNCTVQTMNHVSGSFYSDYITSDYTSNTFTSNGSKGIVVASAGFTLVDNCTFTNHYNILHIIYCINATGNLTVSNSTFSGNTMTGPVSSIIANIMTAGITRVNYCTINSNTFNADGSCIRASSTGVHPGTLVLNNLALTNNYSTSGYVAIKTLNVNNLQIFNTTISGDTGSTTVIIDGESSSNYNAILINMTLANNTSSTGNLGSLCVTGNVKATIIGCTISGNNNYTGSGYGLSGSDTFNENSYIGNTIIAYNNTNSSLQDVLNIDNFISLGCNFIGNATNYTSIFNQPGDRYGINGSPINPYLLPLANNGGYGQTMLTQVSPTISPLINNGNNTLVTTYYIYPEVNSSGQPIDQRGYSRIFQGKVDIGSVENTTIICYHENTKILIKHKISNVIEELPIKLIYSDQHLIFDTITNNFVEIILNAIVGITNRFIRLDKNLISNNIPNDNLLITSGHKVVIDGIEIKAKDVKGAKIFRKRMSKVYSICTKDRCHILSNNIQSVSWSIDEFNNLVKKNNLMWHNNIPQYIDLKSLQLPI